jgi:hypothetical protein
MSYKEVLEALRKSKSELNIIKKEIIAEGDFISLENGFTRKKNNLNKIEVNLKNIKRKLTHKINPALRKYNVYELLEMYPYYYLNVEQKKIINKNIDKIIKENEDKILFNLFLYLFFEEKNEELQIVFKVLAKNKNIKSLKIMESYFLFSNHIVNYNKIKKIINTIDNIV